VPTKRFATSFDTSTRSIKLTRHEEILAQISKSGQMPKCQHFGTKALLGIFEKNTETHVALRGNLSQSVLRTWSKRQKMRHVF